MRSDASDHLRRWRALSSGEDVRRAKRARGRGVAAERADVAAGGGRR